jgi:AcrR family transcriptional regulator
MDSTPPPAKIVPVQDRAQKTRAALLAATERLVAEEGADAVTTTRVAAEAAVSVGSLYRYFVDRDGLLLSAYDGTVARIVASCADALAALPADTPVEQAAKILLGVYLDAAEAIPSHSGLLKAMRAIRPIEADNNADQNHIVDDIVVPFIARFAPQSPRDPLSLQVINLLLGTLVDLYLVTSDQAARARLRLDVEAHMLLALERALRPTDDG